MLYDLKAQWGSNTAPNSNDITRSDVLSATLLSRLHPECHYWSYSMH